jgi:hypothetical protein
MSKLFALMVMAIGSICSGVVAGTFTITAGDESTISVEYTGTVENYDLDSWYIVEDFADGRVILLTINSPGGDAYAGLRLYAALAENDRLVTIAGGSYGAWSAAAIMWLAGDHKLIEEHGAVWFHAAYCVWDPEPLPDIGCDTSHFQMYLVAVLDHAGFDGEKFNDFLNLTQAAHGTDGWIGVTNDGWFSRDTTEWWFKPFNVDWIMP